MTSTEAGKEAGTEGEAGGPPRDDRIGGDKDLRPPR